MRRVRRRIVRRTVVLGGMVLIGAAGAAAAVKLTKRDAKRIEQHTGLPPEQLENKDLDQAMQELNIQAQPLSAQEQAVVDKPGSKASAPKAPASAPASTRPKTSAPKASASAPAGPDYLAELERLAKLRDKGIVTEKEFQAKKKLLLGL